MSLRVLLLEDDRELRRTVAEALAVEGHRVQAAASLADARRLLQHAPVDDPFDLLLLDLGLPDGEGADLLHERQGHPGLAIIVTSARHADGQKIALLDAGADDYLVKPFSIGELLARMRVAMRHRGRALPAATVRHAHDGLLVDLAERRVQLHGRAVHLTPTEFDLLACLVRRAGQVLTHRQLLADVWGPEHVHSTHYLRLYMGQLRAKLEDNPADPRRLLTEIGVGYRLATEG